MYVHPWVFFTVCLRNQNVAYYCTATRLHEKRFNFSCFDCSITAQNLSAARIYCPVFDAKVEGSAPLSTTGFDALARVTQYLTPEATLGEFLSVVSLTIPLRIRIA